MQLELLDIRTDKTAIQGKTGKKAGYNRGAAADGKTGDTRGAAADGKTGDIRGAAADGKTGDIRGAGDDDFLSSLHRVSKKNQEKSGDLPTAASGLNPGPDQESLSRLGDILDEIMRGWPAGKRPVGILGGGDLLPDAGTTAGVVARPGQGLSQNVLGKGHQDIARAWQATIGFTTALIKRPHGAIASAVAQSRSGMVGSGDGKAASDELTAMGRANLPPGNPGKDQKIRILNMDAVRSAGAKPGLSEGTVLRRSLNKAAAGEKSGSRQSLSDLKGDPRTASLKAVGGDPVLKGETKISIETELKSTRATLAEARPADGKITGKTTAIEPTRVDSKHSNGTQSSARPLNPATAVTTSQKGFADSIAVIKPEGVPSTPERTTRTAGKVMASREPAGERVPDSRPAGGELVVRFTPASVGVTRSVKTPGIKGKNAAVQKTAHREKAQEGLGQLMGRDKVKSRTAIAGKGVQKGDTSLVDREQGGSDNTIGQTSRDLKGMEQTRFDVAEAKAKSVDNVVPIPKSQPGTSAAAAPESEKPVLDRAAQARVLEQVTDQIRMQPKKGGNEIRIHLKPETLGQIQLKVLAQDQTVTVKMVAETAMARDIIENNIGQLRADLNALGLNVEKLDVDVFTTNDPGERNSAEQRGSHARNGRGSADHEARDGDPADRVQQMHAAEDEAGGSALIGVFA
ncbi:MAG: flagellar hook-length control protein FliK [Desulfobacterales bacterium]|nr:flagellar hook-length control protein FliK [Desulfobacterales bacterium]